NKRISILGNGSSTYLNGTVYKKNLERKHNRVFEKWILYQFSLYKNGRLKQFVNPHFQQL
ncbi:hypothetical protein ACQV5I_18285, partial [Leptospira interrogans]|uniref:hypothetical protein n=1 Tax=Leptospira interrogans TaxID=173 RepID=UPI003EBDDC2B